MWERSMIMALGSSYYIVMYFGILYILTFRLQCIRMMMVIFYSLVIGI